MITTFTLDHHGLPLSAVTVDNGWANGLFLTNTITFTHDHQGYLLLAVLDLDRIGTEVWRWSYDDRARTLDFLDTGPQIRLEVNYVLDNHRNELSAEGSG